jgi:hypothetical protein
MMRSARISFAAGPAWQNSHVPSPAANGEMTVSRADEFVAGSIARA